MKFQTTQNERIGIDKIYETRAGFTTTDRFSTVLKCHNAELQEKHKRLDRKLYNVRSREKKGAIDS